MTFVLTRQQAFDLAWSRPMRDLASLLGVSNVALAKSLAKAGIPIPERGYWNKVAAGHAVTRPKLDPPHLGTPMKVWVSGELQDESIIEGEPGVEHAYLPLEELEQRFRAKIGSVTIPRLDKPHPDIERLMARADRREARYSDSALGSYFQSPFKTPAARRRLRVMNALLVAASRFGQGGSLWDRGRAVELNSTYGGAGVSCSVEYIGRADSQVLAVRVGAGARTKGAEWRDMPGSAPIEGQITEIVVALARLSVETERRMDAEMLVVKRRMAIEAEEARRVAEAKALADAVERRERLKKQRIEELLQAAAHRKSAITIREFVAEIMAVNPAEESAARWAEWALGQADAIDPLTNGWLQDSIRLLGTTE